MRVTWQELEKICLLLGCSPGRVRGDHLILTRAGMARPVVIKMDRDLGEDVVRTNMQTLGIDRKRFESLLNQIRGGRGKAKAAKPAKRT